MLRSPLDQAVIRQPLNVFTFDQIIGYIETSVQLGVLKLRQAALMYRLPFARDWAAAHLS
jgi:hypothetical protein